ncbi:MAG TPA: SAM-dependent chlorinase/fluorinase, partial [Thermoanaerobaculia bacterium]|nr:SAM-dependent chlorinase/fluorinase [Thermoanaerobaculia bacterium]
IVDVSHQVPPGDVETAAFLLAAAAPAFPAGTVHLAVVDPGVGSGRRILLAQTDRALCLAPDNGLLTPFLEEARKVRSVEREDLFLPGPGRTFHGRDRFAPVAAALLSGRPPEEMGPEIADPRRLPGEPPRREPGRLTGRVVHVDRYGNLVTDIPAGWLPGGLCRFSVGPRSTTRFATHYAEIPPGEPAALPGSLGTIELSLRGDDLARRWGVARGAPVEVAWRPDSA